MGDVWMVAVIAAFFVAALAYVALCDRILGPDPEVAYADDQDELVASADGREELAR